MTGQWTEQQACEWGKAQPWRVGCNFIPSTAINQLEMWQVDTFDPQTISRELQWAHDIGMNCLRVYLHDLLWETDASGFANRMDQFLDLAAGQQLSVMLVLFDDCWLAEPKLGKQPMPVKSRHNSGWLESPGWQQVEAFAKGDQEIASRLEIYVKQVMEKFSHDDRVLAWDIYNEPGGSASWPDGRRAMRGEISNHLLTAAYDWAQAIRPTQPITSGVYREDIPQIVETQLNRSDIVTFHSYTNVDETQALVARLRSQAGRRPMLCTEYMARPNCTMASHLSFFKQQSIGAINWGLVAGKTNTIFPWSSWENDMTAMDEPKVWHHDLLRPDGSPYDAREVDLLKQLTA